MLSVCELHNYFSDVVLCCVVLFTTNPLGVRESHHLLLHRAGIPLTLHLTLNFGHTPGFGLSAGHDDIIHPRILLQVSHSSLQKVNPFSLLHIL